MVVPLWKIAAPELGLAPMMEVEGSGIYITRDDVDCLVLAYSFKPSRHYTRELLEGLAEHILKQTLVDDAFLISNGFKREYGAKVGMKKFVSVSLPTPPARPPTPPVRRRVKRATLIRSAARAIALRLSKFSPRV